MESLQCCVCGQPVAEHAPRLRRRSYCAKHYAKVSHDRASAWRSSLALLFALVVLAALVGVVAQATRLSLEGPPLVLLGIGLALVPAALWLAFFYIQDVLEPEPKPLVLGVAILGALLASAAGIPVVRSLFRVQDWLGSGLMVDLLGSILIVGFVQEFLKYAAVRYSIYMLPEFDERMDGILYGTAAGLGYATVLNTHYVVDSGGVDLGVGVIRIVVTALAQASFSGITGYFLGRAKFEEEPVWWLPLGLTIAAALNGTFQVVLRDITRSRSVLSPPTSSSWFGLVLAAAVAGLTLVVLLYLIRRANRKTVLAAQGA